MSITEADPVDLLKAMFDDQIFVSDDVLSRTATLVGRNTAAEVLNRAGNLLYERVRAEGSWEKRGSGRALADFPIRYISYFPHSGHGRVLVGLDDRDLDALVDRLERSRTEVQRSLSVDVFQKPSSPMSKKLDKVIKVCADHARSRANRSVAESQVLFSEPLRTRCDSFGDPWRLAVCDAMSLEAVDRDAYGRPGQMRFVSMTAHTIHMSFVVPPAGVGLPRLMAGADEHELDRVVALAAGVVLPRPVSRRDRRRGVGSKMVSS